MIYALQKRSADNQNNQH